MKTRPTSALAAAWLLYTLSLQPSVLFGQGTAFTYQGQLTDSGQPANGSYDLRFAIYDASGGGNLIAGPLTNAATGITNGLFAVTLDFGSGVFTGPARWLEVGARTNGAGAFATLSPRQDLLPSPYAIMANSASNFLGTLSAAQLSGTYSGQLTFNNPLNSFCGDGSCLTAVNASSLGGLSPGSFWQLTGNAGTTPGVDFVGTKDNQALQLKVNNTVALQIAPAPSVPNILGGLAGIKPTMISSNVSGAVVAGGNAPSGGVNGYGVGDFQAVYDNDGAIGGGFGNKVGTDDGDPTDAAFATVAGGVFNSAANYAAVVAGGDSNFAGGQRAAVLGGYGNQALGPISLVGGGFQNLIPTNASYSIIGGGMQNSAEESLSVIGGGTNNTIQNGASASTIGGGAQNTIQSGAAHSVVSGGWLNLGGAANATVAGGAGNTIQSGANNSSIGGGIANTIGSSSSGSIIAGGEQNTIQSHTTPGFSDATIAGGLWNMIGNAGGLATIGGGESNTNLASHGTIGGGSACSILAGADFATIPGGYFNVAGGQFSFSAGQQAQALHQGAFVWADSQTSPFASTASDQVSFRCQGGARFFSNPGATVGVQLLPSANAWSSISDRNAKKNFQPVDTQAVLEELAAVPIQRWNYKWEKDSDVPHLGPMAQDFKGAFFPGRDNKSISTMEFDGVELAAIQGLNQKLEQHEAGLKSQLASQAEQLKAKDAAIQSLEQRLEQLENMLSVSPAAH